MNDADTPASAMGECVVSREVGAHVVSAAFDRAGHQAAFALGDGTLRMVHLADNEIWHSVQAHDGAVLALAADAAASGFVSGGDDGRLVRVTTGGDVAVLSSFGGKWVEQVASLSDAKTRVVACAVGKKLHLFGASGGAARVLEHPSTVTGIAFDGRGKRVAASHYNGASLWFVGSNSTTPRLLEWKGSHTAVALHPGAEAVVTAMQENALHGWRLPDAHDMRMSGYPSKPQSLGFTRTGKYLASSGADAIVLWPFFGGGPMGKAPLELAQSSGALCTRVACSPTQDVVAAGYADGSVVLVEIASQRVVSIAPPGHGTVSACAWSLDGAWLAFGTEQGLCALVDVSRAWP